MQRERHAHAVLEAQRMVEMSSGEDVASLTHAASNSQWVQCDDCGKWRRLPSGESVALGASRWTCRDSMLGMCEAVEDVLNDDEDDWK